ncbi:MAG TPA: hypothetical protein PLP19_05340 [bacterium]|nr:hypothetical protein [bacterium]HPN42895.1 hypothetical protein [bacterium]
MKKVMLILTLFVVIAGCTRDKTPTGPTGQDSFAISLLQDHSLSFEQIKNMNINQLILDKEPLLTARDIDYYDYSSHCIYLAKSKDEIFADRIDPNNMPDQPFVVLALENRQYIGALHNGFLATAPYMPHISEIDISYYPEDVLHISEGWDDVVDERVNKEIEYSLKGLGKLHYGLDVSVGNIQIIENSDTATVEYTFIVTNKDTDILYVLDPDKMGSDLFHYFTNGVDFRGDDCYYYSEYKQIERPEPYDSWESAWFTLLTPGEKMIRTISLKGYPYIPAGAYSCGFRFANPVRIPKQVRTISGGRYWIGSIEAPDVNAVVE